MRIQVTYHRSEQMLRQAAIAGWFLSKEGFTVIETDDLTVEQRTLLADAGAVSRGQWRNVELHRLDKQYTGYDGLVEVDHDLAIDEIMTLLPTLLAENTVIRDHRDNENRRRREAARAELAERAARTEQEATAREAKKRLAEQERAMWIESNGSAHLKKAAGGGYDVTRLYETERASIEYPGLTLDFQHAAGTRERSNPSWDALVAAETLAGVHHQALVKVVWLTKGPRTEANTEDECYADEFASQEAVQVSDDHYGHYLYLLAV